jgi:hypothetical protein
VTAVLSFLVLTERSAPKVGLPIGVQRSADRFDTDHRYERKVRSSYSGMFLPLLYDVFSEVTSQLRKRPRAFNARGPL